MLGSQPGSLLRMVLKLIEFNSVLNEFRALLENPEILMYFGWGGLKGLIMLNDEKMGQWSEILLKSIPDEEDNETGENFVNIWSKRVALLSSNRVGKVIKGRSCILFIWS